MESKYPANTRLPKGVGHHALISESELVYVPDGRHQLNPPFASADGESVCLYEYNHKKRHLSAKRRSELIESLQFGLFAAVSLGAPAVLLGTMYAWPAWSDRMIGYMSFEGFFYWTQAGVMAFLVSGFLVALRLQTRSWMDMLRRRVYGSTAFVERVAVSPSSNTLNVRYCHHSLFSKKELSLDVPLSATDSDRNRCFYLKPTVNAVTESPDVR